jgi:hypothetical protein
MELPELYKRKENNAEDGLCQSKASFQAGSTLDFIHIHLDDLFVSYSN